MECWTNLQEPIVGFDAPKSLWSTDLIVRTGAKFASRGRASFILKIWQKLGSLPVGLLLLRDMTVCVFAWCTLLLRVIQKHEHIVAHLCIYTVHFD